MRATIPPPHSRAARLAMPGRQSGLTLVELMISITLGLLVVLAATALLVSSKAAYTGQDDSAKVRDTANYTLELINRAARQAAYYPVCRCGRADARPVVSNLAIAIITRSWSQFCAQA